MADSVAAAGSLQNMVSLIMQRKSMDLQAQSALTLLEALPQPASVNPAHLGQQVDVRA